MNINAIQLPFIKPISVSLSAILLAAYGCIALWLCHGYFIWDFNVYLGLATAPFICTVNKGQFSRQYLIPAVLLCGLAVFLPVHSLLFMAMLFATLFLIENSIGKINHVILFLMLLVSPLFHYTIRLAELPVRFWLSAQVAALLTHIGMPASAAGNQIILKGYEFSVDPACAGLNMLATSLIICLFMVSFYQRQAKKQLHFLALAAMLIATIGLNIVCNYFRITFLVIFKVMPGTFFHDFVGMLCFILYVILPLMYGCKLIFKRLKQASPAKVADPDVFERIASLISSPLERGRDSKVWLQGCVRRATNTPLHPSQEGNRTGRGSVYDVSNTRSVDPRNSLRYPLLHLCLFAATLLMSFHLSAMQNSLNTKAVDINLAGYHKNKLDDGVLKFENNEALIYLKPTAFYAPGHDPMICWTGSGYEFTDISRAKINGVLVYTATLKKGADKIYAAWWFDNGTLQTSDQLQWRWAGAHGGRDFYLVNVNAATPQLLKTKAAQMLSNNKYLTPTP